MKLYLFILINLIFINKAFNQVIEIKIEIGAKRRVTKVDVDGNFAGADTVLRESVKRRLGTSKFKGAKKGTYTVRVAYIVTKDGSMADVECIKDPGYGMGAESVRAVKASGKWGTGPVRAAKSPSNAPPGNK
jgi:hypothetical protein